ncbi:MAG: N,N-dimethylformamidase beta subunit family domain-containing protein [Pseudomonadota bacterium]
MKKILGYSDKISVRPGDEISFMVSSQEGAEYQARIVRLIHGDTSPEGPGYKEEAIATAIEGSYSGRRQEVFAGSWIMVPDHRLLAGLTSFTLQVMVWPSLPQNGKQTLMSRWDSDRKSGFCLCIDAEGCLAITIGDGSGATETLSSGKPLVAREWYLAAASFDADSGKLTLLQEPQKRHGETDDLAQVSATTELRLGVQAGPLTMGGNIVETQGIRHRIDCPFNGKLDSPAVSSKVLDRLGLQQILDGRIEEADLPALVARWDFSKDITTEVVRDVSGNHLHGETVNMPVRAMKGYNWTGREMNWNHLPEEYGAIHFHDDDIYDCGWDVDFTLTIPDTMKSGLYAAHVKIDDEQEDFMPFVVCPALGAKKAKAVFIVPTASYMAYANEHMPTEAPLAEVLTGQVAVLYPNDVFLLENRQYGASCYDVHADGSGVCYTSRLRPILNMRPKYQSWLGGAGSSLWQFNADLHIIDWLEAKGFEYDCITDEDLHREGVEILDGYQVVLTSTHPEYWSLQMWDGLEAFKSRGGRLMYLGANGWYWRVAYHQTKPGLMEVRRAEDGIRGWAAEPGEYYHSFTGEYGGLWRRNGRPPQVMAGTGFIAQGFDISSYYRRKPDADNPRAAFIMEGIDEEIIGDFGLIGNGAAGLELDYADRLLGTPPNALVLASSEDHTDLYLVVCEEILINYPGHSGQESPLVRADIVFYETASGGAVFSSSSIAWAGSLSHNSYDNNVSRMTENVLRRFMEETPF